MMGIVSDNKEARPTMLTSQLTGRKTATIQGIRLSPAQQWMLLAIADNNLSILSKVSPNSTYWSLENRGLIHKVYKITIKGQLVAAELKKQSAQ